MAESEARVLSGNKGCPLLENQREINKSMRMGCAGGEKPLGPYLLKGTPEGRVMFWIGIYSIAMYNAGKNDEYLIRGAPRRFVDIATFALKRIFVYL